MAVNLASKYEKQFAAAFKPNSFFDGKVSTQYNFSGVREIAVYSPVTVPLNNYNRTGTERFGQIGEMSTSLQKMELMQDKSFIQALDRGNYTDQQMAISAGAWLQEEIKAVATPHTEKYAVAAWVKNAGSIITMDAAPAKTTIADKLSGMTTHQTNKFVPEDGRYLYISASTLATLRLSTEILGIDSLGEKSLSKGVVGAVFGAKIVVLPDSFFPENCYALLARKESILLPRKIAHFSTKDNPDNIDGWLMRGRMYFDAFVLGAKADGVTALVKTSEKQATPTIAHSSGSLTLTSASAGSIKYTTDGTDPKYSASALVYSSAVSTSGWEAGKYKVKAVAYGAAGKFTSDVAEQEITIA